MAGNSGGLALNRFYLVPPGFGLPALNASARPEVTW